MLNVYGRIKGNATSGVFTRGMGRRLDQIFEHSVRLVRIS